MTDQDARHIPDHASDEAQTDEEEYPVNPDVWDGLLDNVPTWGDEVIALMLIIFGILSFLSIFNVAGDASIPMAWASTLRSLFGYGSLVVSAGILILGIIMLLPNIGVEIHFPTGRIIALEVTFLSTLALMHLFTARSGEMRAVARAGEGGGLVGWALSAPISLLIGSVTMMVIYSIVFIVSTGIAVGITRPQLKRVLASIHKRCDHLSKRLAERPTQNRQRRRQEQMRREQAARKLAEQILSGQPALRTPVVRIRPEANRLPPSMRYGAKSGTNTSPLESIAEEEQLLFDGAVQGETFNIIGDIIDTKGRPKSAEKQVRRPDGRIKRYFVIDDLDEAKKIGRRKKDHPPLELMADMPLNKPSEEEINTKVVLIENTLLEFDIDIDVADVRIGPTVTQYAVRPFKEGTENENAQRTRISKIASYQNDLSLALSAKRLRIEAPIPSTNYVGIEVPNNAPSIVTLRSVYESKTFYDKLQKAQSPLLVPLGRDVAGETFAVDLASLPHTLIAGTTGSGKSVALAAITMALILHNTPDDLRLIMMDPKMVELSRFNGLPHLLGPVETDAERILGVLRWCTREMDDRYRKLEKAGARNISSYNEKQASRKAVDADPMPYIVIMIDEVGDLMMTNPEDTEHHLTRLAQMARAVGMHLLVATQRPSVDVLTGLIKANFPGRIAFSVASGVDSRVILDASGAEALLGKGDMLFLSSDAAGPRRLQGCFVSDDEVRSMVNWWQDWAQEKYEQGKLKPPRNGPWEKTLTKLELLSETDDLLEDALEAVVRAREASATMLQKHLNVGYPRAARIMDLLYELGAIGPPEPGGKMRKVLISSTRKDPMQEMIDRKKRQDRQARRAEARLKRQQQAAEYADEDDDDDFDLEDEDDL